MTLSDAGFGSVLRQLRVDASLTQASLAERAGISARTISDLERGKATVPHPDTALRLARALELTGVARSQFEAAARRRAVSGTPAPDRGGMRMLPRDSGTFTGRDDELKELPGWADAGAEPASGGLPGIYAVSGMAGVGKTAFVVHAAHRLAERFPDGQIFVVLHGYTPGRRPTDPADALASLLLAAGYPVTQIPPDTESRASLWRHHLTGMRILLVLDDAASSEQLRPLLPGTADSLVLITSRRRLAALEGARTISLDMLRPEDAAVLLVRIANRPDLVPGDASVGKLAELCGYLPLTIGMLARQLHYHRTWTVNELATDLASVRDRLALMTAENLSVAAAFDMSYRDLDQVHQRLFRRLGIHLGPDIDAYAAAALNDTTLATASRKLMHLYDQCLLTEPASGRYRLHDLIKEYARARAERDDPPGDRDLASGRLIDYYQHTAHAASELLARQTRTTSAATVPAAGAVEFPRLSDSTHALRWMRSERANLLMYLDHATQTGQDSRVMAFTAAIAGLLRHDGPWTDAITRHDTAIKAARLLGDRSGEASALTELGFVRRHTSDYAAAARALQEALAIYRDLGDRLGQANALSAMGVVRRQQADYVHADQSLREALAIYRDLGDRLGQANALTGLGVVRKITGDLPGAAGGQLRALRIYNDLGNRLGRANVLTELGDVRATAGEYALAIEALEEALRIFADLGNQLGQANALTHLGRIRRIVGNYAMAASSLEKALRLFRDLGDRGAQATVLNGLGSVRLSGGAVAPAKACHSRALDLARATESSWDEANALTGLGRCARTAGRASEAAALLRQAHRIFDQIGAAESAEVSAELAELTQQLGE